MLEMPDGSVHDDVPEQGRILDALKRCFRLPTPPPEVPAAVLHSTAWLASVIDEGLFSERRLTWAEVERLHPLARALSGELAVRANLAGDARGPTESLLRQLLRVAAPAYSWEEILRQAAEGELDELLEPELAAWMDEGMFSRWILSSLPSLDQLLHVARQSLVPSAARRLSHVIHRPMAEADRLASG